MKYHVKLFYYSKSPLSDQICLPDNSAKGSSAVLKSKCFFFNIK